MSQESDPAGWLAPIERLAELAPLYVAHPLATFLRDYAQTPRIARLALFSLCESIEAVVRFLAICRAVEIITQKEKTPEWLAKAAANNLLVPTFGKWMNLLREIAERGGDERSMLVPELADASARLDRELFAKPPSGSRPELHNILSVRNPIAHGSGISDIYAATLLDHWAPKIAGVLAGLDFLTEIALWTRDPEGCKRLNGPQADRPPQQPPQALGAALPLGGVALSRAGHIVMLHPLGRRAPHRDPARHLAQIFVRESDGGLVYNLFGAEDALQAESSLDELERLERMFNIAAIRATQRNTNFQQRDYDKEFASDAAAFVGREEALDTLWQAVVTRPRGIVYVFGPAGIGKSSLVARVAEDLRTEIAERAARKQSNEMLLVYRFIDRDRGCAPLPFLLWLIERLAVAKGTAVKAGFDLTIEALRETALQLLADSGFDRVILVLDGLDEMARREKRFIIDLIGRLAKIDRLLVLASSRPEPGIDDAMKAASAVVPWSDEFPEMSRAELRAMLVTLLPRAARKLVGDDKADDNTVRNDFIAALVARAKGLPLYVRMIVQATHAKDFTLDRLKDPDWLPDRVVEFFDRLVDRGVLRTDVDHLAPIVGCLLALAKEPLSADEIGALLSRDVSPRRAELIRRQYGLDPVENVP